MADTPRVLVTGASGFIATHVVQQLLQGGQYLVRGTVRSLKNPKKIDPLRKLCENPTHELELVETDLTKDEGWLEAVQGCDYVLHTASPFPAESPSNEDELIKPAVEGTLRIMKAVKAAGTVKRVVLTSSVAAVSGGFGGKTEPFTEADWTNLEDPENGAYIKSKTLAEKAAWDFLKELADNEKFELAVINPAFVLGPVLSGGDGTSMTVIKRILTRDLPGLPRINFTVVDVRDVAAAHINAMTVPEAAGSRFLLTNENFWFADIGLIVQEEFKPLGYNPPTSTLPKFLIVMASWFDKSLKTILPGINKVAKYDNSRMRTVLGIEPIEGKKSIVDMCYSLIEGGHVDKTEKYKKAKN